MQLVLLLTALTLNRASGGRPTLKRQLQNSYSNNIEEQMDEWSKDIASETAFQPILSKLSHRQRLVPENVAFPCDTRYAGAKRSASPPTSVHRLRPGDIDVVAAIGDSLVAGDAALEDSALGIFIQYRGVSWCIGGQADWRRYLTLPNIIKYFNPNVTGYSLGEGSYQAKNSRFNVAMPAALDDDALKQARLLVSRIKADRTINFNKSWKLVTIFIGHNDLCSKACFEPFRHTAAQHAAQLQRALDYLQRNLPRTFVSLVTVADVTFSLRVQRSLMCRILHPLLCACLHRGPFSNRAEWVAKLAHEYANAEKQLVESGRYDSDPQFAVEIQPFSEFTTSLGYLTQNRDLVHKVWMKNKNLVGPDCFHVSQAGAALMANMNWNNLLEAVGNKSTSTPAKLMGRFICPSFNAPFLFTRHNSELFVRTGRQY